MIRVRPFLGCVALAFLATFVVTDGLHHEPAGDEQHFLDSAGVFQGRFELEALRSYPELVTPLALVIWGELEHFTGDGLFYGRLLNLALTFAMVCLIALSAPRQWPRARLAAVGLLLFPYTLPLSAHLYTDPIGAFLVVSGTLALARGHPAVSWLAFVCAIATRQYLVQIPAALAAASGLSYLRGERARWKDVAVCAASGVTLLAWVAFFGGLATPAGIEDWLDFYPAPMMSATEFILFQGLYALTGVGAYFVVVEALLFQRHPVPKEMRDWRGTAARDRSGRALLARPARDDPSVIPAARSGVSPACCCPRPTSTGCASRSTTSSHCYVCCGSPRESTSASGSSRRPSRSR